MRVTDLSGVDLSVFRFDTDLTFAVLLMHADGTIYHTVGGRSFEDPTSYLSLRGLLSVLEATLEEHAAYARAPSPPAPRARFAVDEIPLPRGVEKPPDCYHCHHVNEFRILNAQAAGRLDRARLWDWIRPDPIQVGLVLDGGDPAVLAEVRAGSPAEGAGLRAGDRLLRLGGRPVLTFGDVAGALHLLSGGATGLPVTFDRGGEELRGRIETAAGWKEPDPLTFSWRPSKWPLSPKPGFGGKGLDPDEKAELGLSPEDFASRVTYLVTWGPEGDTGRRARAAGLEKSDVLVSVAEKRDFRSEAHFQAWFRLTRRPGESVPLGILRDGIPRTLQLQIP